MNRAAATGAALSLDRDGAALHRGAASDCLDVLTAFADRQPQGRAGVRLAGLGRLRPLLGGEGPIGRIARAALGNLARPVRAVLFDKSAAANWSLAWHQDRTICVQARREVAGFGPWTVKSGLLHVAPPMALLERMVTIRVHLDPVPADNAPLLVAPGSHRLGLIAEGEVDRLVASCGSRAYLADAGDV